MTPEVLRDRVTSVCADLGFVQAKTPFSFDLQPTGELDEVFRVEMAAGTVIGGFNYTEERTDLSTVWVARKHHGTPDDAYRLLVSDVSSIRSAVVRDGISESGEYHVPNDGFGWEIARESGKNYAVLRVTLPLNYETTL